MPCLNLKKNYSPVFLVPSKQHDRVLAIFLFWMYINLSHITERLVWLVSRIFDVCVLRLVRGGGGRLFRGTIEVMCNPPAITIPCEDDQMLKNWGVSPSNKNCQGVRHVNRKVREGLGYKTRIAADPSTLFLWLRLHCDVNTEQNRTTSKGEGGAITCTLERLRPAWPMKCARRVLALKRDQDTSSSGPVILTSNVFQLTKAVQEGPKWAFRDAGFGLFCVAGFGQWTRKGSEMRNHLCKRGTGVNVERRNAGHLAGLKPSIVSEICKRWCFRPPRFPPSELPPSAHASGGDLRGVRPWQNEDTLWRQHCVLRCCPSVAKRGNIVARRADARNVSEDFQKHFLCPGHTICVGHKCCARGRTRTFGKHDHVSNVAATMCPRFASP